MAAYRETFENFNWRRKNRRRNEPANPQNGAGIMVTDDLREVSEEKAQWTTERVKALRIALSLSQEALARAVNVSVRTAVRWERGVKPQQRHAERLDKIEATGGI